MILGTPEILAIEYTDLHIGNQKHLFGRMRLLVKNVPIGNFDQYVLLNGVHFWLKVFVDFTGVRFHESLAGKNDRECLEFIWWALHEVDSLHLFDRETSRFFENMEFCPRLSPAFDGDKAIVLDFEDHLKFIYQPFESNAIGSIILEKGYLEDLLMQFMRGIESELPNLFPS